MTGRSTITKLLVANRGEIACRIFRTARRLGIATVAVYSDADARAMHVDLADEAVRIGPAEAARSYLSIEAILDACARTGADAVHPGYGFLSERAAFAEALQAAGLVFVGPNPRAIAAMGDKIGSKAMAAEAGVSVVPGYPDAIGDEGLAVRVAEEIGYPVMLKASAGGGGKGMRVARSRGEVVDGFARARSEAASSFGDDRILIEKFIDDPRHIEIQILGDKHGNVVHLGERECSIQRRNQKVLEEAPSPFMDARMREAMGAEAVALAKAVGYDSAGTVEFVVGQDASFYFLEMNTRLQVEHPVTEFVTGLDIVELMLRSAMGEPLSFAQEDVRLSGWAVESRIYAEDPFNGFAPSTGRIGRLVLPDEGATENGGTLRIDRGVRQGDEVPVFYDPMIGKLVSHAADRRTAIEMQIAALDRFSVGGIKTNLPFLSALMRHPRWNEGRLSTRFIEDEFPGGFGDVPLPGDLIRRMAAVAASLDVERERAAYSRNGCDTGSTFRRERALRIADENSTAQVELTRDGIAHVRLDDVSLTLEQCSPPASPVWRGRISGVETSVDLHGEANGFYAVRHEGCDIRIRVLPPRVAELAFSMPAPPVSAETSEIHAITPGVIVSISVRPGMLIAVGDAIAVVEAMKMETVLRSEVAGSISEIHVSLGEAVAIGHRIATLLLGSGPTDLRRAV